LDIGVIFDRVSGVGAPVSRQTGAKPFSLSTCISILMHVTLALITPNALTFQLRTLE